MTRFTIQRHTHPAVVLWSVREAVELPDSLAVVPAAEYNALAASHARLLAAAGLVMGDWKNIMVRDQLRAAIAQAPKEPT